MGVIAAVFVIFVALFHVQVFILETLQWQSKKAREIFGITPETAKITKPLAVNQGFYNLFLAAGLLLSFLLDTSAQYQVQIFILICVIIAAAVASLTVKKQIFIAQGVPAIIALIAVMINY